MTLATLRELWSGAPRACPPTPLDRVDQAAASVDRIVAGGKTVYGINTGFGLLAQTRIPADKLADLQRNLILSHSCGLGDPLPRHVTRLMIVLKLIGLGRGHSGVRRTVIDALQHLLDADALPLIPAQGSVGASGDLAPLAHLVAALMGEGRIDLAGEVLPAAEALRRLGRDPLLLAPKEGLALINGTQASTAIALDALFLGERVFAAALHAGALSVDALKGSCAPFDARIHALRGQPGQIAVAARLRDLLDGSQIVTSHHDCDRVQDPYSFRCQPQVMGAALDLLVNAARTLQIEANAVTDNPILFPDSDEVISGGNFHAQPVAFAADIIAMALCEVGSISERRTSVLVDPNMSRLPAFLTDDGGVNSGLMIPQVTAAALVSENKSLAFPAQRRFNPDQRQARKTMSAWPRSRRARRPDRQKRRRRDRHRTHRRGPRRRLSRAAYDQRQAAAVHAKVRCLSPHLGADRYWADEMAALQAAVLAGEIGDGQRCSTREAAGAGRAAPPPPGAIFRPSISDSRPRSLARG